ncbi:MAG: tetratricopeptide repeat protein [Peptococcaceae bacterium]|nr:tetratricopeptide repeat protein [Peptococcaceae bacterium]
MAEFQRSSIQEEFPIEVKLDPEKSVKIYNEAAGGSDYGQEASEPVKGDQAPGMKEMPEAGQSGAIEQSGLEDGGQLTAGEETASTDDKMDNSWNDLLVKAKNLYQRGVAGDKEAVKEAYEILVKVRELALDNNLVEAYYGSILSLLGRDAVNPAERFNAVLKGLKILDRSVANEPDNVEIITLRANVCYRLPEKYFHRTETAIADFNYLASRFEQDAGVFSQEFYCRVLYDLGVSYKRLGREPEAKAAWQKLLSVTDEPKYRDLLRQEGFLPEERDPAGGDGVISAAEAVPAAGREMLKEGIELHRLALEGDKKSLTKALSFFKKALQENPDNPLVKAYYADCLSLSGQNSMDIKEMFSSIFKAIRILETAVKSRPDDVEIRMIRASHSFRLPEVFFRRTTTAIADFEYLARRYEEDPTVFPVEIYRRILYHLGEAYRRLGLKEESGAAWDKLLSLNPGPQYVALIREKLGLNLVKTSVKHLSPDNREEICQEGVRLYDLAMDGNKAAAAAALELWQKVHETDPGDTLAQAYYGSCLALVGQDSNDPGVFFGYIIKGLKMINHAAAQDQNNPWIRMLRAYMAYSLPQPFFSNKIGQAIEDFQFLKTYYEQDNTAFPAEQYGKILYGLGMAYERTGDIKNAGKIWKELLQVSKDPKYRTLLKDRIVSGDED